MGTLPDAPTDRPHGDGPDPAAEVVDLCPDLIPIDTTNNGDREGPGERKAAEHVAALLDEVGIPSLVVEAEPGRTNVIAQWGGTSRGGDGLLLHGEDGATGTWKRIVVGDLGPRLVVTWSGLRPTAIPDAGQMTVA